MFDTAGMVLLLLVGAACNGGTSTSSTSGALEGWTYGGIVIDAGSGSHDGSAYDTGAGSGFDAGTDSGSDSDADTDGGSGTDSGSGSGVGTDGGSGSDAGTDGGPGSGAGTDGGSGSDAGSGFDAGTGGGSGSDAGTGGGSGSDAGTCSDAGVCGPNDICVLLQNGLIDPSTVGPDTLDHCNEISPTPPSCTFTTVPAFFLSAPGCHVQDPSQGDLGNYSGACPTDIYEQQALCDFAKQAHGPARTQTDADQWIQGPGGNELADSAFPHVFGYPNPQDTGFDPSTGLPTYTGQVTASQYWRPGDLLPNNYVTFTQQGPRAGSEIDFMRQNEFRPRNPTSTRALVVLGSSMMSTHNQIMNGRMCSRASTRADARGLVGNDFEASPAWITRVPWAAALALGRTGFATGDVFGALPNTTDACQNPWAGPNPPAQTGVNWLNIVGRSNGLMVTDGGLINDQQSRTGGWSDSLAGLVLCNAMEQLAPSLDGLVKAEHVLLNPAGVIERGRLVARRSPAVVFRRQVPRGGWAGALDLGPNDPAARCWYETIPGNGINPLATFWLLSQIEKEVPPLIRLWVGGPPNSPVPGNLRAIRNAYTGIDVKQIWLQYPYMDQANVVLRGADLMLLWPVVARRLIHQWGPLVAVTIPAIDAGLRPRIQQVTDDLNKLMYDTLGCNAVAPFAPGHPPRVCARNVANAPRVVITQDAYAGWGAADHQTTIVGGMPHESAAGANKMGAAIVAADLLP